MLDAVQIKAVQSLVDPPAVTLVLRNDRPGRAARLDALFAEVESRLSLELEPAEVMARIRQLVELAQTVDEDRGQSAIVLFASARYRAASRLPEPVEDRVVVDDTFATGDLVRAWLRSPSYVAVLLADPAARLFLGQGRVLREVADRWFPVLGNRPDGRSERGRRQDPSIERDLRRAGLHREVDLGLDECANLATGPFFVLGTSEQVAAFLASSRHRRRIAGAVSRGIPSGETVAQVARAVWPAVEEWLARRQEEAIFELDAAKGCRRRLA